MDIVLRKRLCVNIYKPTFTNKLMRSISLRRGDQVEATGVVYEVVSNIPKVRRRDGGSRVGSQRDVTERVYSISWGTIEVWCCRVVRLTMTE